jgi:hypothetical protein
MMMNVSHVKVDVPANKKIGVFVSGGWDSAVLLYNIWDICIKQRNEMRIYTVPKLDGAKKHAEQIVKWCRYKLITEAVPHDIVGSITAEDPSEYVKSGVVDALMSGDVDIVYSAVTKYYDEMDPDQDRIFTAGTPFEDIVRQPFADMTKDQTVQMAFDLGIAEDLMKYTHSCTELDEGRCGYCPWCKEREWAFKQINKIDKGTN